MGDRGGIGEGRELRPCADLTAGHDQRKVKSQMATNEASMSRIVSGNPTTLITTAGKRRANSS